MRRLFATLLAVITLAPQTGHATADGPDAWRVTGVASDDVLNVRVGPGTAYFVIDALPHDARGVQMDICVPTVTRDQYFALGPADQAALNAYTPWCLVEWQGVQRGWVNRRFLTEDMD
ncbi:hypothetical protein roselon_01760 [Roseibacterium elongatum DSM 19469]|uniref:SH3b domain-containing protein n=1 Tax=Roseicyclus elongatus DSM 19469 TaxID=1294273 RepID=W8S5L7_9RHOB|nr:hypothetical protein [Roseibacterium elongatum]AHM04126.1 hypothetical protein roselon_01760 [Roseibacterium elongatum DSM 19469]